MNVKYVTDDSGHQYAIPDHILTDFQVSTPDFGRSGFPLGGIGLGGMGGYALQLGRAPLRAMGGYSTLPTSDFSILRQILTETEVTLTIGKLREVVGLGPAVIAGDGPFGATRSTMGGYSMLPTAGDLVDLASWLRLLTHEALSGVEVRLTLNDVRRLLSAMRPQ